MSEITVTLEFADVMVASELTRLARECADQAAAARAAKNRPDETFFQRGANAYTKALTFWLDGVRPRPLPTGGYLLPSSRPGEAGHVLTKDADWRCTCPSGDAMHWAAAMVIALENVADQVDMLDDAPALPYTDEDCARAQDAMDELYA